MVRFGRKLVRKGEHNIAIKNIIYEFNIAASRWRKKIFVYGSILTENRYIGVYKRSHRESQNAPHFFLEFHQDYHIEVNMFYTF